jgi:L-amino acid N-acyltransferase YncA
MDSSTNAKPIGMQDEVLRLAKSFLSRISRYTYQGLLLEAPLTRRETKLPAGWKLRAAHEDPAFYSKVEKHFPDKLNLFRKRLEQGLYCITAYFEGGVPGGWTWFATADYFEPKYRHTFRLASRQIYQFDGFIKPEFRKGLAGLKILPVMHNYFLEMGYTSALAVVDKSNEINLKYHSFMGFKETGKYIVVNWVFGISFTHVEEYSGNFL